jgi:hypothetical protein
VYENIIIRIAVDSKKKKDGKSGCRKFYDDMVDNSQTYASL